VAIQVRRSRQGLIGTLGTLVLATALAACSSGGSSSATSSGASSPSGGGSPASGGSSSASSSSSSSGVAAAQAFVSSVSATPTTIPITAKIGKPIPAGKTIDYINCGTPACVDSEAALNDAAKLLGWQVKTLNTDGTPAEVAAAWQQIIVQKPAGVVYAGFSRTIFNRELLQAKADGIKVVAFETTDPATDGIDFTIGNGGDLAEYGRAQAAWISSDSGGSADTLYVNVPQYSILTATTDGFTKWYPTYCSGCQSQVMNMQLADVGTAAGTTTIVAYLRSHPSVKYLSVSLDAILTGVPAALRAAGITGVKLVGSAPTSTNYGYIAAGQESATVQLPIYLNQYMMVDALARLFVGLPIPQPAPQIWLITKANLPSDTAVGPVPTNMGQLFAAIWGKS
jgi:ribose transport system substrate-binding protein